MRLIGTICITLLSFYLLFNTSIIEFIISYLLAFPLTYLFFTLRSFTRTKRMLGSLSRNGRYILSRRKETGYYRFFLTLLIVTIAPFIMIAIHPVIALGFILGFLCGHGFSELTHYAYVKSVESELGGKLYYFISEQDAEGYFYTGVRVLKYKY